MVEANKEWGIRERGEYAGPLIVAHNNKWYSIHQYVSFAAPILKSLKAKY